MAAKSYAQLHEGEWTPVPKRGHKNACCNCGLVHRFKYRVNAKGQIELQAVTDKRATAAIRRGMFPKEED